MEKRVRSMIMAIISLILVIGIIYFYPENRGFKPITSSLDDVNSSLNMLRERVSSQELKDGWTSDIQENEALSLNLEDLEQRTLTIDSIDEANENAIVNVDGVGEFTIKKNKVNKVDLNSDGFYDIIITLNEASADSVNISINSIYEKQGVTDMIGLRVNQAIESLEKGYQRQSYFIFSLFLILLLAFIFYLIKNYILPMIRIRNMRKGRNSTQVFRDLINEIERAKKLKENQKEQKLRSRLVHLYSYLSEEEKKPLKKYMERYIN